MLFKVQIIISWPMSSMWNYIYSQQSELLAIVLQACHVLVIPCILHWSFLIQIVLKFDVVCLYRFNCERRWGHVFLVYVCRHIALERPRAQKYKKIHLFSSSMYLIKMVNIEAVGFFFYYSLLIFSSLYTCINLLPCPLSALTLPL